MTDKELARDEKIIPTVANILDKRVKKITFKEGFSNRDISSDRGTSVVYRKILFKLLELMILDVIDGNMVYFNKKTGAKFYVDYRQVAPEFIMGKGIKKNMCIPLIDLKKSKYRMPFIAFDPGYKKASPCLVYIPNYLFSALINNVNKGKKYAKGTKDFWFNKKPGFRK